MAIIDTGVDASHPELAGRIAYAADFSQASDDGGASTDEGGHGTHVASLACAKGGNGIGIAGAGYGCSIIAEKIDFSDSSIAAAIVDAARHGAEAINMSFGTDGSVPPGQALLDALRYARKKGAVLVAAAADEDVTEQGDPANVLQPTNSGDDITRGMGLSVAAAQYGGGRAWFSGRGSQISLAAYGAFARREARRPAGRAARPPDKLEVRPGRPVGGTPLSPPATLACSAATAIAYPAGVHGPPQVVPSPPSCVTSTRA